jgi:hypothetical protein
MGMGEISDKLEKIFFTSCRLLEINTITISSNTMKSITLKTSVNSEDVKDRASIKLDEYMTWSNQFISNRLRQPVKGLENMKKFHIKIFCLCDGFIFFI